MPNRLADSTSPYLQQHRDNPVDWHEWGPEALALARESGKPILLSVGYSACHWCHVMAHESFEDEGIAALMNRLFVNIKVDREERPDIDQIYQTAHAMLTQRSGGWPLTLFLTADTVPFFGGTYFPKSPRYGLPGFADLLEKVSAYHRDHPVEIRAQNAELQKALGRQRADAEPAELPTHEVIEAATRQIGDSFDRLHGGFGRAPKFPHPEMIDFCLRRGADTGDAAMAAETRHCATFTLAAMCRGGIFDQLGGGFARYSVDGQWAIPHFEKMLYDNGPLLRLLSDAWLCAEDEVQKKLFAQSAEATAAWVLREMQSPAGGYYSTLDADSEGHEGKFYVWTADEVQALLTAEEWQVAARHFGLDRRANFEDEFWNLVVATTPEQIALALELSLADVERTIASARQKLFQARAPRIRPGRDEKILTSWNALMIEGMAHAARVFDRPLWLASARAALDFVRATLWDAARGRLNATHKDGKTHLNAYLDDYAYLLKALIEMMQADFRAEDLAFAMRLADVLLEQFEDAERGGFFFTSHDHESLIQRPKPGFDNATPSGNGVAAYALQRLGHLCGEVRYLQAAERALTCFAPQIDDHPSGHGSLLMALEESLAPPTLAILTGDEADCSAWQRELARQYRPATMVISVGDSDPDRLPAALRKPRLPGAQAWVCHGLQCDPPVADLVQLQQSLSRGAAAA